MRSRSFLISEARDVLDHYSFEYPKSLNDELSSPKLTWAPNHPNVTEDSLDRPILHNLNAKVFCHTCEDAIKRLSINKKVPTAYSWILRNKYLTIDRIPDGFMWRKLNVGHSKFYDILDDALYYFANVVGPKNLFKMDQFSNV